MRFYLATPTLVFGSTGAKISNCTDFDDDTMPINAVNSTWRGCCLAKFTMLHADIAEELRLLQRGSTRYTAGLLVSTATMSFSTLKAFLLVDLEVRTECL